MTSEPIDVMSYADLVGHAARLGEMLKERDALIVRLREENERDNERIQAELMAANRAFAAIYRMVELAKDTGCTHAQREGQFIFLLKFIAKCWPGYSTNYYGYWDASDIPF